MHIISELQNYTPERGTLLTIGVFDGVHLGHQHLIETLCSRAAAKNLLCGVVTFSRHPRAVLLPQTTMARLTTLEERTTLFKNLGVDLVVPIPFDSEVAALSAREFVTMLQKHLRMQGLVIGPDFALGRGREGNVVALKALGQELGFTVEVVGPLMVGEQMASSTAIRQALSRGDMETTSKLLGRHFSLSGTVVGGRERGQTLGYPTANLEVDSEHALPADGVYATRSHIGDTVYKSVTNIGMRPTFNERERTIEVFLLDFTRNIYGEELTIDIVERLRGEMKFADSGELVAQIDKDVERAKELLE
ncbi:MAG: bifunctional riboflavin kinase/FAD synthetase [Chloroflexota bacterium]|nr:bifunctional riboflavin kinase/FAD synthetase [Chloroflexota bacterium]